MKMESAITPKEEKKYKRQRGLSILKSDKQLSVKQINMEQVNKLVSNKLSEQEYHMSFKTTANAS